MTRLLVADAAENFRFWTNLQLMKAFGRACALTTILLLLGHSTFAAESSVVAPGAQLEKLAEGYSFTDGPAAYGDGNVFFTDNLNYRIIKWSAADGTFSDWLKPAGRAVGTNFDKAGNLIVAATEKGELWPIAPDKTVTRVATGFIKPGGIIGTPDGKVHYVADFIVDKTYAYDINPGGELTNKRLFCQLNARGMTIDTEGNVYLVRFGVTVFDKTGKNIEHIDIPEKATNIAFGGKDNDLLFVAAAGSVYGLKMRVKGAR